MGGLICCCWRTFCCECTICEPRDDWDIKNEARAGERGAGWLTKRGKNAAVWSKRFFVITDYKLIYYTEKDRLKPKGEIILAGATASASTSRANSKNHFYFTISHAQCGTREMYAKTNHRRAQWMELINDISNVLEKTAVYGKLFKQGGLSKNQWQERFCVCSGRTLDYFDGPTDNQSKGSLDLLNCTVKPLMVKDRFCFELATAKDNKKGDKKYIFSVEKEEWRDSWIAAIKTASVYRTTLPVGEGTDNPIQSGTNTPQYDRSDSISSEVSESSSTQSGTAASAAVTSGKGGAASAATPKVKKAFQKQKQHKHLVEMSGYLQKKSPALLKGWQKRYFIMRPNGEIVYYKNEEECSKGAEPKGVIDMGDILRDVGLQINKNTGEITIRTSSKMSLLKAANSKEAQDWGDCIVAWIEAISAEQD